MFLLKQYLVERAFLSEAMIDQYPLVEQRLRVGEESIPIPTQVEVHHHEGT